MGVSGQRHAPAALLPPGKGTPVPIGQEAGWAPEPVWTQRLQEKSFAPAGNRTPTARFNIDIKCVFIQYSVWHTSEELLPSIKITEPPTSGKQSPYKDYRATDDDRVWLQTEGPEFDPWQRQWIFPLASVSRPSLRPNQPPIHFVPEVLYRGKRGRDVTLTLTPI
jgi:hypothetical protein